MHRTSFVLFIAILSLFVVSDMALAADGWTSYGTVTRIDSSSSYPGIFIATTASTGTGTCASPTQYFLPDESYSPANLQFKAQIAQIMAAYLTGRSVAFYTIESCAYNNAPRIDTVRTLQ